MKRPHDTKESTAWPRKMIAIALWLALFSASAPATPAVGFTVQSTRSPIPFNVFATQGRQSPLFNLLMLSSNGTWGYDLIHATNTWAPAAADGTPTQTGWHSHPVPIGLVQVLQGGIWEQDQDTQECLTYHPTGSMFVESMGHQHNVFNFDQKNPAVTLATWFLERSLPSFRTDEPDPVTGGSVASAPPTALCPGSPVPPGQ